MSFDQWHDEVREGDTVILHVHRNKMHAIIIEPGKVHQTKFGAFPHDTFVGKKFGTKVFSKNNKGYVHILHPTPELWSGVLKHRTQILYPTDISVVLMELELHPGSVVVESGTGSGSLSHAIIRTIAPSGHLHTFDFHQQRVNEARREFQEHGIAQYVTASCRDVCAEGFGLENVADAVFLDLPKPWETIAAAKKALKQSGGRLCSFSPCIEQVQKTSHELKKGGFCGITTIECLLQTFDIRTEALPVPNFGQKNLQNEQTMNILRKLKRKGASTLPDVEGCASSKSGRFDGPADEMEDAKGIESSDKDGSDITTVCTVKPSGMGMVQNLASLQKKGCNNILVTRDNSLAMGHTGYLTFASLFPEY